MDVIVIGGGIGGLSFALALHRVKPGKSASIRATASLLIEKHAANMPATIGRRCRSIVPIFIRYWSMLWWKSSAQMLLS